MEKRVLGSLAEEGLEVVGREGRLFVRYDAGAHQIAWREDEITEEEFEQLKSGRTGEYQVIIALQRRLQTQGVDPYAQNWQPMMPNPSFHRTASGGR